MGWGFRACLRTTKEKVFCVSGEQDKGFWEPDAAVSQYGHNGASLGQSRPSQLRCWSPGGLEAPIPLFRCTQWVAMGRNREAVILGLLSSQENCF